MPSSSCFEKFMPGIKIKIRSLAVVVDPINEEAILFYRKYGFIQPPDSGKMFLPMKTISKLFD